MNNSGLIACIVEGQAERIIMSMLLDQNKLIFSRDDLLDYELLRCRKAKDFEQRHLGKGFESKITVYRVLDSRREQFRLSKAYESKVDVINVVTAPEIEVLVILKEQKYTDYSKHKSRLKPSEYCRSVLKLPNVKTEKFLRAYFCDINILINVIQEYKSKHQVQADELCLADLLNK